MDQCGAEETGNLPEKNLNLCWRKPPIVSVVLTAEGTGNLPEETLIRVEGTGALPEETLNLCSWCSWC